MIARFLWRTLLICLVLVPHSSLAQDQNRLPVPPRNHPPIVEQGRELVDLRRRLIELDRLLSLESLARAQNLLGDLEQHSALARELVSRRIRLAQLKDEHHLAVDLCREAVIEQPLNPALWRAMAASLLAVDNPDSARIATDMFIRTNPNARSAAMVSVDLIQMGGYPAAAIAYIDSLRITLAEPRFMGRQRAVCLLQTDQPMASADEVVNELRFNPFNLSLIRTDLLENVYRPGEQPEFLDHMTRRAAEPGSQTSEWILVANLHLVGADAAAALDLILPLLETRGAVLAVLQNSVALGQEIDLLDDQVQLEAVVDYLLAVLEKMTGPANPDPGLRQRAADYLAMVCESGLENGALGDDPGAAVQRYGELLTLVRQINPSSQFLYSSQIKLAAYTRDVLQEPRVAAGRLERMLMDLDLPTEGVALVRLTLGECYLAAGDTARGRTVLTQLGRDPRFREAGGHAHYHLARLDLAQGNFATARDRFAVVAMDNPAAPYANDSLDLGLAIAEEMDNPSGGPAILQIYAGSVYYDLTAHPQERLTALQNFVQQATLRLDLQEKQHLLERGRFELAMAYQENGRQEEALAAFSEVIAQHPDGRFPGLALMERSRLLWEMGRSNEARQDLELLLAQYPDYLFIDDARDQLRNLP